MHDSITVLVAGQPTRVSPAVEKPKRVLPRPRRITLSPVRKLTRAHLSIAARPPLIEEAQAVLAALGASFTQQLGTPVAFEARLVDATLHPISNLAAQGAFALLELHGDAVAVLELDALAIGALLQHAAGGSGTLATPIRLTRIEEAAFGWQLLSALNQVRKSGPFHERYTPRLLSLHFERTAVLQHIDGRRKHLAIALSARIGDVAGSARLLVPSTWLQLELEKVAPSPAAPLQPALANATLEAACLVGKVALTRGDAEQLTPGDVLVFPALRTGGGQLLGPGRLTFASFELRGAFEPAGFSFTCASQRPAPEHPMSEVDPSLPVEVEVELTRLRLPLHELGSLKPGGVLPLQVTAAQTVVLRVGDRPVARAELVEIDGEIGARILSML